MKELIKIEFLRITRNKKYFIMSVGMPVAFYIIFTEMLKMPTPEIQKIFAKEYLISMTTFSLTSFALYTFPFEIIEDRKNGWRILLNRLPIKEFDIFIVKILKMLFFFVIAILLVFCAGFFLRNVDLSFNEWLVSAMLLLFGAFVFLSLGILLSNFKDEKSVSVIANILFLGLAMLGGLWFPVNEFPEWLQTISKMTPTYHFRELAVGYINTGTIPLRSLLFMILFGGVLLSVSLFMSRREKESSSL